MGGSGSKHKLSKEDLDFLISNTEFDKKLIKKWHKGFMRDCPSGQLSKEKFLQVYSQFFPEGNAESFCEHVFRTFDNDQSGKIDFKEFLLAINITSGGSAEQKLAWAFTMYDIDGNGTIEKIEMREIITAIYHMVGDQLGGTDDSPEKRTEEIFCKMDLNSDGVLSKEEFVQGCMNDPLLCQMLTAEKPSDE